MTDQPLRVVCAKRLEQGTVYVLFAGTYDQCIGYLRSRTAARRRNLHMMYSSGRLASWVI